MSETDLFFWRRIRELDENCQALRLRLTRLEH